MSKSAKAPSANVLSISALLTQRNSRPEAALQILKPRPYDRRQEGLI